MTQGNDDSGSGWQAQTDVADDTVRVPIVCKETDRETWEEAAILTGGVVLSVLILSAVRVLYDKLTTARGDGR